MGRLDEMDTVVIDESETPPGVIEKEVAERDPEEATEEEVAEEEVEAEAEAAEEEVEEEEPRRDSPEARIKGLIAQRTKIKKQNDRLRSEVKTAQRVANEADARSRRLEERIDAPKEPVHPGEMASDEELGRYVVSKQAFDADQVTRADSQREKDAVRTRVNTQIDIQRAMHPDNDEGTGFQQLLDKWEASLTNNDAVKVVLMRAPDRALKFYELALKLEKEEEDLDLGNDPDRKAAKAQLRTPASRRSAGGGEDSAALEEAWKVAQKRLPGIYRNKKEFVEETRRGIKIRDKREYDLGV